MVYEFPAEISEDERQKLFDLIYRYETIDFRESQNFTTRDCYGVVDRILAAGFRLVGAEDHSEVEVEGPVHLATPEESVAPEPIIERRVDDFNGDLTASTDGDSAWSVVEDDPGVDDPALEYAVANFGDLDDIIEQDGVARSTRSWAQYMLQPNYGDLLVARPYREHG